MHKMSWQDRVAYGLLVLVFGYVAIFIVLVATPYSWQHSFDLKLGDFKNWLLQGRLSGLSPVSKWWILSSLVLGVVAGAKLAHLLFPKLPPSFLGFLAHALAFFTIWAITCYIVFVMIAALIAFTEGGVLFFMGCAACLALFVASTRK